MTHPYPLTNLREPSVFLQGARLPLLSTTRDRAEWIVDDAFYQIGDSFEREFLRRWLDEDEDRPTGIDEDRLRRLSLDLADPDVARWVDRKIAESYDFPEVVAAVLCVFDGQWCIHLMGVKYPTSMDARFDSAFDGIPCDLAHVPTARAALLNAIYGKEKP